MHLHLSALYACSAIVTLAYAVDHYILKPRAIQRIARRREALSRHVDELHKQIEHEDAVGEIKTKYEAQVTKWTQLPTPTSTPPAIDNERAKQQIRESLMKEKLDEQPARPKDQENPLLQDEATTQGEQATEA